VKKKLSPFLRWAGGKRAIVHMLCGFLPDDIHGMRYIEPFLGGGALFFAVSPEKAIISDANAHLINCYLMIRDRPDSVATYLRTYSRGHSKHQYYGIRREYNLSGFTIKQAARFIYLNKASFNGIFRVNRKGEFNVPYGKKHPALPSLQLLNEASKVLQKADIRACSYEEVLSGIIPGDFVYLDPPYPPLNGTSYFTHYTKERFHESDQIKLAEAARLIDSKGCKVLISNADTPVIRSLYKGWKIDTLPVIRYITCKAVKHKANEVVIRNY
jgi:DNA adenine methylase